MPSRKEILETLRAHEADMLELAEFAEKDDDLEAEREARMLANHYRDLILRLGPLDS